MEWQTRQFEGLVPARACRFKSCLQHSQKYLSSWGLRCEAANPSCHRGAELGFFDFPRCPHPTCPTPVSANEDAAVEARHGIKDKERDWRPVADHCTTGVGGHTATVPAAGPRNEVGPVVIVQVLDR